MRMRRPPRPTTETRRLGLVRWGAAGVVGILSWLVFAMGPAARSAVSEANQVARGRQVYAKSCAACHGPFLEGRGGIPRLAGSGSRVRANYVSAEQLHSFVSTAMPFDRPGKLKPQEYWDVVAFLWSANGVDPGNLVVGPDTAGKLTWDYKPSAAPPRGEGEGRGQVKGGSSQGGLSVAATAGVASVASAAVAAGIVFVVRRRRRQPSD